MKQQKIWRRVSSKEKLIKKANECKAMLLNVTNVSAQKTLRTNPLQKTRTASRLTATSSCLKSKASTKAVFQCIIKTAVVLMTFDAQKLTMP